MAFDPASNAALLAQLVARALAGQLFFTTRTASRQDFTYIDHAIAKNFRPVSSSYTGRTIITWSAVYRSPAFNLMNQDGVTVAYVTGGLQRAFGPESYVCDTSNLSIATGMVLTWIKQQFDLFDEKSKAANLVPQMHP